MTGLEIENKPGKSLIVTRLAGLSKKKVDKKCLALNVSMHINKVFLYQGI